jgi:lipoprotein-anchoring transpeptidase ErfK/SrfK
MVWYLEYQLSALNYRPGPVDGLYDYRTADAVMAFEKVERLRRDGVAGEALWQKITTAQTPDPKLVAIGSRVEIDLTRQVLLMITDNKVWKVIHVSTGRSRGTPTGPGRVGTKQPGWVAVPVGRMYYVSYIRPHIAIHGSASVPSYPASHGCVRVPKWMAEELFYELPVGTRVDVYYR